MPSMDRPLTEAEALVVRIERLEEQVASILKEQSICGVAHKHDRMGHVRQVPDP